jgi:hypothetical protein
MVTELLERGTREVIPPSQPARSKSAFYQPRLILCASLRFSAYSCFTPCRASPDSIPPTTFLRASRR